MGAFSVVFRKRTSYIMIWDSKLELAKHPAGGLMCILARPEMKPQDAASSTWPAAAAEVLLPRFGYC
jgi:hypothetical protein